MSYIIWIVVGTIIVIMAIIGYVAEKNGKHGDEKVKTSIPEVNVAKLEANEGAATWSRDAKPKDERQEVLHEVPSIDDWTKIPDTEGKLSEVKLDVPKYEVKEENVVESEPMFADIDTNNSEISEPATEVLSVEPTTTPIQVPTPTPVPAAPQSVTPVVVPATDGEDNLILTNSEVSTGDVIEPVISSEPQVSEGSIETSLDVSKPQVSTTEPATPVLEKNMVSTVEPAAPLTTEPVSEQITEPINVENIWS